MTDTKTPTPADADLLDKEATDGYASGDYLGTNANSWVIAGRLRALARVLRTITPAVVRAVQRREENLFDAADSMDTSPGSNPEWREMRTASEALMTLLTPEQRAEVERIADKEPC